MEGMKHLVRNLRSREYLTAHGQWGDLGLAMMFPDVMSLLLACQKYNATDGVEMVLVIGDRPREDYDIALPLFANQAGVEVEMPNDGGQKVEAKVCERCQKPATHELPRRTREAHEKLGPSPLCDDCFAKFFGLGDTAGTAEEIRSALRRFSPATQIRNPTAPD